MSGNTKIEWADATWNPVRGCTKISPGCKNCYAETFAERWRGVPGHPYEQGFDLRLVPEKLGEPLKWKKPKRIFVNSMSDLFQEGVPFDFIAQCFDVMIEAHWHIFQILTKRADRMLEFVKWWIETENGRDWFDGLPNNIWLGASCENQQYADERIPKLLQTPAAKRFVSYEPALGPVAFDKMIASRSQDGPAEIWDSLRGKRHTTGEKGGYTYSDIPKLDWVIVGGESGTGARPMQPEWARSVRDQCVAADVPFFFKQWGGVQKSKAGRELDGRTWDQFPK